MVARLIRPDQPIEVKNLCVIEYGQPGSKKTSLLQTARNPITFASDKGIYRAYRRKDCVMFDTWEDIVGFDCSSYDTIGIDTGAKAMEYLAASIIAESPKNGNRQGGLSISGYGLLANRFAAWIARLRTMNKDIVMVCHEDSERVGDQNYYSPSFMGQKFYTIAMQDADLVGYLHLEDGKRVLDFHPSDRWMAKSPPLWGEYATKFMRGQSGQLVLPDFASEPDFLSRILEEAKAGMGRVSEAGTAIVSIVRAFQARLTDSTSVDQLNAMLKELTGMEKSAKIQCWESATRFAQKFELVWKQAAKKFEHPKKEEPEYVQGEIDQ